ncbi:MAG TPA: dephospho-CoA kinase [Vicinamibacterales bacterium]
MLRIGLTGGIATGKSYCLKKFAALGVPVIDADILAREAVTPGSPALQLIQARFGPSVIAPDGSLDRPVLASIVFSDRTARADLESIIHPEVYRRINEWFANQPTGVRFAIADIPLLFETGHEHDFDAVIVVACEPFEQLRRLIERDGLPEEAARARLAAQWPIGEKVARADFVIRTDGTFDETESQVREVFDALSGEI